MVRYWLRRLLFGQPVVRCERCGCWVNPADHPLTTCSQYVWKTFRNAETIHREYESCVKAQAEGIKSCYAQLDTHHAALEMVDAYLTQDSGKIEAIEEFITRPEPLWEMDEVRARLGVLERTVCRVVTRDLTLLAKHEEELDGLRPKNAKRPPEPSGTNEP